MPYNDLLVWQQYIRDSGNETEIMMRGFLTLANLASSKRISAEKLFPFLSPTHGMDLATKIQYTLRMVSELNNGREVDHPPETVPT